MNNFADSAAYSQFLKIMAGKSIPANAGKDER